MQLIGPLTGAVATHWGLVPVVETRIQRFIERFHGVQNPADLVRTFKSHFVMETGLAPAWIWASDGAVVGHLFAWMDTGGRRSLFVGQVWSDLAVPNDLQRAIVTALDGHARALHCWAIEGWVKNPAMLRLYRKIGVATPIMTAVRRVLDEPHEALHVVG